MNATGDISPTTFSGATWNLGASDLLIGANALGNMTISTGGSVTNGSGSIATFAGSTGRVEMTGGTWTNSEFFYVGERGNGTLTMTGNGTISAGNATTIAAVSGSTGVANISGGQLSAGALLYIGESGNGTLNLSGSGVVTATISAVGVFAGTGLAQVSGGNWTSTNDLFIGYDTRGTVDLSGNGSITSSQVRMGALAGGNGTLNLRGGVLTTGQIEENLGSGAITFNGGTLRLSGNQGSLFNGFDAGDITLVGAGGTIDTQTFSVATAYALTGNGSLTKTGNGTLTLTGNNTYSGGTTVRNGTLVVSGGGAINHSAADLTVGFNSGDNATLTIAAAGRVNMSIGRIAAATGSAGAVFVNGGNLISAGDLFVGSSGNGSLSLTNGTVSNTNAFVGNSSNSTGTVTVTGGNWTNSGQIFVGSDGNGTLNMSGGTVSSSAEVIALGTVNGSVSVSGGRWNVANSLTVGNIGSASLLISGTGFVSSTDASISGGAFSNSTVSVSGGNWTNSSFVEVGSNGAGTLNVSGGQVSASNVTVGAQLGSGTINLTGGVLATSQVSKGSGNGTVTFNGGTLRMTANQSDLFAAFGSGDVRLVSAGGTIDTQAFDIASALGLTGNGSLTKTGNGTLSLSGNSTYTGNTTISTGTLLANNASGSATGTGAVNVLSGATLGGNGTIGGSVVVANGGILSPGNSPGILTISGNLSLNSTSITNFELATPTSGSDRVDVGGNLILDGVANITALGGFGNGNYTLFNYCGNLTNNGLNFGIMPALFDLTLDLSTAQQVNLIVAAATAQYWDGANTSPNGIVDGGTGTWGNGTTNWTNTAGNANSAWSGTIGAVFSGSNGTVTIDNGFIAQAPSLSFATTGYVLTANGTGSLELTGSGIVDVLTGGTATINAPISGNATLVKTGAGTLILGSSNTYSGGTNLQTGALFVADDNAFGTGTLAISANTTLGADGSYSLTNNVTILGDFSADVASTEILELGGVTSLGNATRTITLRDEGLLCFSGFSLGMRFLG